MATHPVFGGILQARNHSAASDQSVAEQLETWHERGIEALILGRIWNREDLSAADWSRFVVIALGGLPENLPVTHVRVDSFGTAYQLWQHCWRKGY